MRSHRVKRDAYRRSFPPNFPSVAGHGMLGVGFLSAKVQFQPWNVLCPPARLRNLTYVRRSAAAVSYGAQPIAGRRSLAYNRWLKTRWRERP